MKIENVEVGMRVKVKKLEKRKILFKEYYCPDFSSHKYDGTSFTVERIENIRIMIKNNYTAKWVPAQWVKLCE